jgi:hypothetical protein
MEESPMQGAPFPFSTLPNKMTSVSLGPIAVAHATSVSVRQSVVQWHGQAELVAWEKGNTLLYEDSASFGG